MRGGDPGRRDPRDLLAVAVGSLGASPASAVLSRWVPGGFGGPRCGAGLGGGHGESPSGQAALAEEASGPVRLFSVDFGAPKAPQVYHGGWSFLTYNARAIFCRAPGFSASAAEQAVEL